MNQSAFRTVMFVLLCLSAATAARAQGTIAGTAKDTSEAVLPGVTVEATSPVGRC